MLVIEKKISLFVCAFFSLTALALPAYGEWRWHPFKEHAESQSDVDIEILKFPKEWFVCKKTEECVLIDDCTIFGVAGNIKHSSDLKDIICKRSFFSTNDKVKVTPQNFTATCTKKRCAAVLKN